VTLKPIKTIAKLQSGAPVTIAAIGDSLTCGWMARKGYLDFLKEMLRGKYPDSRFSIIASGVPGDTTDFGLYRVDTDVLHQAPDCVFIQYAINDAGYGFTVAQFRNNIQGIIDKIRKAGDADIVLVTSGHIGDHGENHFAEEYYELAREIGVNFVRFTESSPPNVSLEKNHLTISMVDTLSGKTILLEPDLLVLSAAFLPSKNKPLSHLLKVPLDQNGFFLEAHAKLRPVDFATEGIFLCGAAQWPKSINESVAQATGAAARGARLLAAKKVKFAAICAVLNQDLCMGCGACEMICPFSAIKVRRTESGQKAMVSPSDCKGCGTCGASCPQKAIEMRHFTDTQILKQIYSISEDLFERAV